MSAREKLASIRSAGTEAAPSTPRQKLAVIRTNLLDQIGVSGAEVKRRVAAGEEGLQEGLRPGSDAEQVALVIGKNIKGVVKGTAQLGAMLIDVARASGPGGMFRARVAPLPATRAAGEAVDRGAAYVAEKTGTSGVSIGPAGEISEFMGEIEAPGPEVITAFRATGRIGSRASDVIAFYERRIADAATDEARAVLREEMERTVASMAPRAAETPVDLAPPEAVTPPHMDGVIRSQRGSGAAGSALAEDAQQAGSGTPIARVEANENPTRSMNPAPPAHQPFTIVGPGEEIVTRDFRGTVPENMKAIVAGPETGVALRDIGDYYVIDDIRVDASNRGQGIGTSLYEQALDLAEADGKKGLLSKLTARNADSNRRWVRFEAEGRAQRVTVDGIEYDQLLPVPRTLRPEAAPVSSTTPLRDYAAQRFPGASIEAVPDGWVESVLASADSGQPGLSIGRPPGRRVQGTTVDLADTQIVYRDPEGNPIAVANLVRVGDEYFVRDFAASPEKNLLTARAAGSVARKIEELGVRHHYGEISEDALRLVQRHEGRSARGAADSSQPSQTPPAAADLTGPREPPLDTTPLGDGRGGGGDGTPPPAAAPDAPGGDPKPPAVDLAAARIVKTEPVNKVLRALREARPLRREQQLLYRRTRAERFADAKSAAEKAAIAGKGGEASFYDELGSLKGEMPRVEFESLRAAIDQEDIDDLFRMVAAAPDLSYTDTLAARKGLAKMFGEYGGQVPTDGEIALLRKVFGNSFTEELVRKRPMLQRMADLGLQIANLPRALMSSFDLSAPFRQGVFFVGRPRQFFPAFRDMFRALGSEEAYQAIEESIRARSTYELMQDSRLALTDLEGVGTREEAFASNLAERIPVVGRGVRASGRAYTAFLAKLRADLFDDLVVKARGVGLDPETDDRLARSIAGFVNAGTGRGSFVSAIGGAVQGTPKALGSAIDDASKLLNTIFFSPRLIASRLTLLNPAYYLRQPAFVRKEALKSLATFIGFGATVISLAKLGGADVELNARSSDFGKIHIRNTRLDVWGGFQQYVRMFAQLWTGEYKSATSNRVYELGDGYKARSRYDILLRQIESKEAPIPSFITTVLRQQDYRGQPVSIPAEIGKRFAPMLLQDLYELWKEDPELLPIGALSAFGFSVQTFGGDEKGDKTKRVRRTRRKREPAKSGG